MSSLATIERPRPVLDREREEQLTERQREVLRQLDAMFRDGFAELTMAEIAARAGCSLRTLYALAPSRDELVLMVVDRQLWRIGGNAQRIIADEMPPLDAIRAYLRAAHVAVSRATDAWSRDIGNVPAVKALVDSHNQYLIDVTRILLDTAVGRGDIADVDTAAIARVLAGLGRSFADPEVARTLRSSPPQAADEAVQIILKGLLR
ncbi:TetR/AcrR family transcriptional regulator [Blastococcus goldschmidtiae]|uniref:TetR/AcrR family transcriptional regulator n=1 Tax=Blastococcus goldschmidtiae TaxID=3075546 RepID=A0ABU2KA93_9ACTN|nr:TetR/AcrR family transcriptional regulator [Blastococcus sp. DSM 46792]MDT0277092.1 TetR/AcrR family transcriptional regulator [Blastococcus sp. DSM 46792]